MMDMKEERTRREEGHEGRKDTKGGRTQREGGHKGREDMKGGRTQREGGHEGKKCDRWGPESHQLQTNLSVAAQL